MEMDTDTPQTPCPLGMIAATVALMTRYVDPARGQTHAGPCDIHPLLAKKIVSNLFFLQHHPDLPPAFGRVMAQAHAQWRSMIDEGTGERRATFAHTSSGPTIRH